MKLIMQGAVLSLIDEAGIRHDHVRPVRLFPLTDAHHWVAILGEGGRELACVEDVATLSSEQRDLLEKALAKREFVPVIRRIFKIARAAGGHVWHVETDRGKSAFRIEADESIQSLGGGRLVIIDSLGIRYLVANVNDLDRESSRKLERYY